MKVYKVSEECGRINKRVKYFDTFDKILCDTCIKTYKNNPIKIYPKDMEHGVVYYDDEDKMICHLCGRSYKKLTPHIKHKHNITPEEYKEKFELNRGQSLVGKPTRKLYAQNINLKNIDKIRIPFKKGHTYSKGKSKRLQYRKNRTGLKYKKQGEL